MTRVAVTRRPFQTIVLAACLVVAWLSAPRARPVAAVQGEKGLVVTADLQAGTIVVSRTGSTTPILTHNARADQRPYLHPIVAPDGKGVLTEYSPSHHKHQTGLYWGFTRVNGRDFFHNPAGQFWRRVAATVTHAAGEEVRWQTVYDLLDEAGQPMLTETQRWSMREDNGSYVLDLDWRGEARTNVTIGTYDYGGLFLRMPWQPGMPGEVVNAARQRNARAEGQRSTWIDVGLQVPGRDDLAHVAIFDHPQNPGYPQAWRVDSQMGVGSARTRAADWTIAKDASAIVRHRFLIYTGRLDEAAMTRAWTNFSGADITAMWRLAQSEGKTAKFLTPEAAVAEMTTMDGYVVNAFAGEPSIAQPMAFCWDDRGRLWVAENLDYETRGRGFSNAGTSRIVILEDADRDGRAENRTVFMEGIIFPTALAVGFDGVFIGAPPNLLFVPDRNGDDKADEADIEVRLTGWGIKDRHETLNSLHWGPDGWLYGLQGFATPSKVRRPPMGKGRLYAHRDAFPPDVLEGEGVDIDGGVWRYHPTEERFEVVAHGFSNPWGIDHDAKGQLLITACVIPHLWHVIPGGIYQRQGGRHFNPYVYSDLQTIADHRHRSAHGGARVYLSDAFPAAQHGRIFMANIHEHAVLSDVLVRKGSGFTAHHGDDFLLANNAQWIGFSLEIGPDGALYVLDWHDADICGNDVLHKDTGRIFRVAPSASAAEHWEGRFGDLRRLGDKELVALQTSRSAWHARRARLILQARASKKRLAPETWPALRTLFETHPDADVRLRAMWALHVTRGFSDTALLAALADRDEHVRAWAVQLLCERGSPGAAAIARFAGMARDDASPVVRLYLASALQRLDRSARWGIASALMAHGNDAADHNLPTMIWLGVEPLVKQNPALALDYASKGAIPLVSQHIARRAVDAGALETLAAAIAKSPTPASTLTLLRGMRDGLEGRFDVAAPRSWSSLAVDLKQRGPEVARLAAEVASGFNDAGTARQHIATLRDTSAPVEARRRALQMLAAQRRPQLAAALPAALDDEQVRIDAIRAVAAFDDESLGKLLIARYPSASAAERVEIVQALASRRQSARLLTTALSSGVIERRDVPVQIARQLVRLVGAGFTDVWGPVETTADEEHAYARYRALLTDGALGAASAQQGRAIFQRTCGACHRMYGEGGTVGPDITGSNRTSLDYLLFNVLTPNADVQDAYKMVVVTTRDGRTFSGTLLSETDRQFTLRIAGSDPVTLNKADIQSRDTTDTSLMPPGLFDALSEREVIDLVAYLKTADR